MLGQQVEQRGGADQEHAGVPAVLPRRDVGLRRGPVRLLHELGDRRAPWRSPASGSPAADVAEPGAACVGSMPIVTSSPASATSAASRTQAAKAASSVITWSAANEPISASGSSRSSWAAASPIAAIESRGEGSASTRSTPGSWRRTASSCAAPVTTTTRSPTSGVEPVDRGLDQRAAAAGEVEQELGRPGPRERPQPGAGAPGGDDGPQPVQPRGSHGAHPAIRQPGASAATVPG